MFRRGAFSQKNFKFIGQNLEFDDFHSQLNFLNLNHNGIIVVKKLIGLAYKILDISVNTMFKPSNLSIKLFILVDLCDIEIYPSVNWSVSFYSFYRFVKRCHNERCYQSEHFDEKFCCFGLWRSRVIPRQKILFLK